MKCVLFSCLQAGLLGYHDVRDTEDTGHHAKYDDIHKNYYPGLAEAESYDKVCSEKVSDDEFSEGWTRDTSVAEYTKALRHSMPQTKEEVPAPVPPTEESSSQN